MVAFETEKEAMEAAELKALIDLLEAMADYIEIRKNIITLEDSLAKDDGLALRQEFAGLFNRYYKTITGKEARVWVEPITENK
jgi:hypothetical protein